MRTLKLLMVAQIAALALMADGPKKIIQVSGDEILPQIAIGGGWQTEITLYNTGPGQTVLKANFYQDNGQPWIINLAGIGQNNEFFLTLAANQLLELRPVGGSQLQQGWVQLDQQDNFASDVFYFGVFRQSVPGRPDFEATVPPASFITRHSFVVFNNTNGFRAGIALLNANRFNTAPVTVRIRDENGNDILIDSFDLPPLNKTVFDLGVRYPSTEGRRGSIEFTTPPGGTVTALGLRFNPTGPFTSVHAFEPPQ